MTLPPPTRDLALKGFRLRDDLARLALVADHDVPEATIFYCARILEAVAALALRDATGELAANVWAALRRLGELGLLSTSRKAYFHALRRLGNDVRHMERAVGPGDADVAVALLARFLAWHATDFPFGPREAAASFPAASDGGSELHETLACLDAPSPDLDGVHRLWKGGSGNAFVATPVVTALYAEQLVAAGGARRTQALGVVDAGLARFAEDVRLRQLRALALRRLAREAETRKARARLEQEAEQILNALGTSDPETLGLLAALHKDRYRARPSTPAGEADLRRAAKLYSQAWEDVSKVTDTYTGINAATTALLVGEPERSSKIAQRIVDLYEKRRGLLAAEGEIGFADYYDRVTLAEAQLLLGDLERARRGYRDSMTIHASQHDSIETTKRQLADLLRALGLDSDPDAFLTTATPPPTPRGPPMYVPKPIDTRDVILTEDLEALVERLAAHVHDIWAQGRIAAGWTWGAARDDASKKHPCLVPYDDLPESEKDFDRRSARDTLKAMLAMGYRIGR